MSNDSNGKQETVYIRFRKRVSIQVGQIITLGHVAQLLSDRGNEDSFLRLILCRPDELDGNRVLIDMLQVVSLLKAANPDIQIEHFGDAHALVEIETKERTASKITVTLVWLLLFIGSGLAIMNFHADVSMMVVHQRIYELLTGIKQPHPYLLQIPYSFGIGIGMAIFFNHLFKKKFNEEPSPLDVEMFLYQENMNHYVITEEYEKMNEKKGREGHGRNSG